MRYKDDLTIIYITANLAREYFAEKVREQLVKAAKEADFPIISVSQKPMDFGDQNICVGEIGQSFHNAWRQMLAGAKAATTKYIAIAEDDTLYSDTHFNSYRPADDTFGYDMSKWSVYTWKDCYCVKRRINGPAIIAPRELFIEAIEERFEKALDKPEKFWSELGKYEKHLGIKERKIEKFFSSYGIVVFSHEEAMSFKGLGKRKRMGEYRAYDIPYWGHFNKMLEMYNGTVDINTSKE